MKRKRIRRKVPWTKEQSESYTKALKDGVEKVPPRSIVAVHPTTKEDVLHGK